MLTGKQMAGHEECQEPGEPVPHSFIIKIQHNGDETDADPSQWRIQIIHVMSGEKLVFEDVENIKTFIWPFLQELDIEYQPEWLRTNG